MQFKLLTALTAALLVSQAHAQMSAKDVVDNIKEITSLSKDANDVAKSLISVSAVTKGPVRLIDPSAPGCLLMNPDAYSRLH